MAKYTSAYPGTLITHEGEEIGPGDTIDLPPAALKVPGVAEWIDRGWLVKGSDAEPIKPAEK